MRVETITIDPEFRALIPALQAEERALLEESILAEGCRDALVTWDGVLLDGHNRYEICQQRGIIFDSVSMQLPDRSAAQEWIIRNQFGRRNLSAYDRTKLALRLEELIAARAKENQRKPEGLTNSSNPINTRAEVAKAAGVAEDTVAKVKLIEAEATPEEKTALAAGTTTINKVATELKRKKKEARKEAAREENRAKVAAVPSVEQIIGDVQFSTILIDPPWDVGDEGDVDHLGRQRPKYATKTIDELLAMKIPAADDSHIYLWITNRSLPKGFVLLERWGFRYITALTWVKPHYGMGNYFRGQTEHLLFGVKGSQMLKRKDVGTVIQAPRGTNGHSSKPTEIYPLIESCSPGPYLEMFSRCERPDWTSWGENS